MKRYSQFVGSTYVMEDDPNGKWAKYSDAEDLIKELYKTIDNNSKKLIRQETEINLKKESIKQLLSIQNDWEEEITKLVEQNKEMLTELKHCRIFVSSRQKINTTGLKLYDQLIMEMEN